MIEAFFNGIRMGLGVLIICGIAVALLLIPISTATALLGSSIGTVVGGGIGFCLCIGFAAMLLEKYPI